jgi:hypothetical protein
MAIPSIDLLVTGPAITPGCAIATVQAQ